MMQQRFNVGDKVIYARSADGGEPHLEGKQATVQDYREYQSTSTAYYDLLFQDGAKYTVRADHLDPAPTQTFYVTRSNGLLVDVRPTLEQAITRAEVLAGNNPGTEYQVLQTVAAIKAPKPVAVVTRL